MSEDALNRYESWSEQVMHMKKDPEMRCRVLCGIIIFLSVRLSGKLKDAPKVLAAVMRSTISYIIGDAADLKLLAQSIKIQAGSAGENLHALGFHGF